MKKLFLIFLILTVFNSLIPYVASAQDLSYEIGNGDMLEISVWKDESLSRTLIVPPDGIISFPLIGDIDSNNLTVAKLRKKIAQQLSAYVPDATVTVILRELNSLKAYVIGKVNQPGQYPISLDTTVMQLLSKAGGLNPYAAENKIHILRNQNNNTVKISFDYGEVLKARNLDQNIVIKRGDVLVVP